MKLWLVRYGCIAGGPLENYIHIDRLANRPTCIWKSRLLNNIRSTGKTKGLIRMQPRQKIIRDLAEVLQASEKKLASEVADQRYLHDIKEAYTTAHEILNTLLQNSDENCSGEWQKVTSVLDRYVNDSLPCHSEYILLISTLARKIKGS